jgi:hypothetical protein
LSGARQLYERSRAAAPSEPRPLTCLSIVAADTGDFDVANACIEQLQATWVEAPASDAALARCFAFAGAVVALISRDTSRLDLYVRAARQVLATPDAPECYRQEVRLALAIIAVLRRDAEAATEQYPQLHASSAGVFLWHLTVDRVLGLLARTMGDAEASAAHFEDALRFCRRGGYRPELGWTCLDYAELLLAVEDRAPTGAPADQARAGALLKEGLQVAQELGMRPLMERVLAYGQIFEE